MPGAIRCGSVAMAVIALAWAWSSAAGPAPPAPAPPPPEYPPSSPAPPESEPWLGLLLGDAVDGGVQVVAVVPGGPADRAGVRDGDLVIRVNGADVADRDALRRAVGRVRPGDRLAVSLLRNASTIDVVVVTSARPGDRRLGPPGLFRDDGETSGLGSEAGSLPGYGIWIDTAAAKRAEQRSGLALTDIPRELRLHYGAPEDAGVLVARVDVKGPAAKAGVRVGDVLVRAGGSALDGAGAYATAILRARSDAPLALEGIRSLKAFTVVLVPAPQPAERPDLRGLTREQKIRRLEEMMDATRRKLQDLERELEATREAR